MIFFGWFDRRDFNMDITDSIESLLELLKLKFEFAFIKYSKYDISKILYYYFVIKYSVRQSLPVFTEK